jgi:hypothetical protein
VFKEPLVRGHRVFKVLKDSKDRRGFRVLKDSKDRRGFKGLLVQVYKELLVLAPKVHREFKVLLVSGLKAFKGSKEPLV